MPDPQGYPLYELTNLQNNVVFQIWSDGSIVTNVGTEITSGNGSPNGVITAPPGSMYIQKDATPPNMWWQKQTGSDNNGWAVASGGGGVTNPGGNTTDIQFNDGGAFNGDDLLTYNKTTKSLTLGGPALALNATLMLLGSLTNSMILEVHNSFSTGADFYAHSDTNFRGPSIILSRSGGTQGSPTAVLGAFQLGYLSWQGYDGTAYQTVAQITAQNSSAFTGSNRGTTLEFSAVLPNTTAIIEVARFCNQSGANSFELDTGLVAGKVLGFMTTANQVLDTGFSRTAAGTVALGNGTQGNTTGNLQLNQITKYNNETLVAPGAAYIRGNTVQKAETGADVNVLTVTPAAAAGLYRITVIFSVSAATAATLGWTATWTDSNGIAQAPTNLALNKVGVAAPALTFAAVANDTYCASWDVDVNAAGVNIVVKTTFSGTSIAYKASATIERLA